MDSLLKDTPHVHSGRGSGIGVKNVNERIRLYFGEEYGLVIRSEPDEGTRIRILLPAVSWEEVLEREKPGISQATPGEPAESGSAGGGKP